MKMKYELKYGCNPNQKPASVSIDGELPITVLNGRAGYINLLDALNGYQLARELREATGYPGAASFKHVSPAGAAIGLPLDDTLRRMYFVDENIDLSPLACAYVRARGADRMSSFGDFAAVSDKVDMSLAKIMQHEVSDGIIAPDYDEDALELLKTKKKGNYTIIKMDESYVPDPIERRTVYGITFEQGRNNCKIDKSLLDNIVTENRELPESAKRDLVIALIALKYTQSNSVCYAENGQTIGVGAGQQSRIHCTRLAGGKADFWHLRSCPKVLSLPFRADIPRANRDNAVDLYLSDEECGDVLDEGKWQQFFTVRPEELTKEEKRAWLARFTETALASDAFFPFGDNIERAHRSGVRYIAEPGGSVRDEDVIACCNKHGIVMAFTGLRLFHH
ncbi:MAG: phosphoribosylaminoimidazolecarboxamide formyltransferase [Clostridiales bacterium]|nr:phosphoribosylaminoimidazolecarboxamide formyltransferase [Clostridiales bacterium]MDD7523915.1 phosphoribosylaminoimidazolecarboxamide formyltransferase [Clostridiales bacterium]MDD7687921.1 phosphoribosylaminoimidazolecarboxamide formyltransferase [Clostridiales bacterium]MDY4622204.1 phosphoribosylaminoimidazolecarboxamide formyltransferase [Eubacteriales bacterium]MDY5702769.1 phosphoribosylaminoimidazolecarboxamide formyltransferase [Eubacteriales bacterium]